MNTTRTTGPNETRAPLAPIAEWLEMSKEERAIWLRQNGKGYLSKEEQEERLRTFYGDIEYVYMAEANRALEADDGDGFWQWLSLTGLPAHSLAVMKLWYGTDFVRGTGFDTTEADKAYGPGWLEQ